MLDKKIAKDAFSVTWRFMLSSTLVMLLISNILTAQANPDEMLQSPMLATVMMFFQLAGFYFSMYVALWWHALKQSANE